MPRSALICLIGWHRLEPDVRRGVDRCVLCGREWRLFTIRWGR